MLNEALASYRPYLEKKLSPARYRHTLAVARVAQQLAKEFSVDNSEAVQAGLLHDCARDLPQQQLLDLAQAGGLPVGMLERAVPVLLHAPVGALLAERELGVHNRNILEAITFHTTGRSQMSQLEKVVYLADVIEPGRCYPDADKIRRWAREDLDRALLVALNCSLKHILEQGQLIHPQTVEARNCLLTLTGKKDRPPGRPGHSRAEEMKS